MKHMEQSYKSVGSFIFSNVLYILWFILYVVIAWLILGASPEVLFLVLVVYGASVAIALSPTGEILLRLLENIREPHTQQERDYLTPIFEEVYDSVKEVYPNIGSGIKIYIIDAMYVNAFAIGRCTIAVTKGALTTLSADELKGVIAHEFGHMKYGHTKALLLSVIGNLFFSIIVWFFRLVLNILQIISTIVAHLNFVALGFAFFTFLARILVDVSAFIFINLSQVILALNSRTNEIQADRFAHDIGYGEELISCLYLFQKITMNAKMSLIDRAKASHPHLAYRIAKLEELENNATWE